MFVLVLLVWVSVWEVARAEREVSVTVLKPKGLGAVRPRSSAGKGEGK